jgi:hypothetical protein
MAMIVWLAYPDLVGTDQWRRTKRCLVALGPYGAEKLIIGKFTYAINPMIVYEFGIIRGYIVMSLVASVIAVLFMIFYNSVKRPFFEIENKHAEMKKIVLRWWPNVSMEKLDRGAFLFLYWQFFTPISFLALTGEKKFTTSFKEYWLLVRLVWLINIYWLLVAIFLSHFWPFLWGLVHKQ